MRESLHFNYDGISSKDMGVMIVNSSSGLFEESFLPSRNIIETKIPKKLKPYYFGVDADPLQFSLEFLFIDGFDSNSIRKVARWLYQDTYKPLYTDSNPSRIFYCMGVGNSNVYHNGNGEGYMSIDFRCDSPFAYTPVFEELGWSFNKDNKITLIDHSNFESSSGEFSNVKVADGKLTLTNKSVIWRDINVDRNWGEII